MLVPSVIDAFLSDALVKMFMYSHTDVIKIDSYCLSICAKTAFCIIVTFWLRWMVTMCITVPFIGL